MPSTLQMAGPMAATDDAAIDGVRRSRLSIHLSTPRVRRWLLVQMVSVPVHNTANEPAADSVQFARAEAPRHVHLGRLVDDYTTSQMLRRVI
ncbi:MAG: hypothetical protein ACJ78Q_00310 [Chloroflexia bacterium]